MWGDKKEDKTPEQSKADIEELVGKLNASFSASLDERLKPITEKVTAIETKWSTLEGDAAKEKQNADAAAEKERADLEDPDGSMRGRINEALTPLAIQSIKLSARFTETEILNDCRQNGWAEYIPQIQQMFEAADIREKANEKTYPQYCRNVVRVVIGDAAMKGGLKFDGNKKTFFIESGGNAGGGGGNQFDSSEWAWTNDKTGATVSGNATLRRLGIDTKKFEKWAGGN